jgi:uncharacterized protein YdeI (YjbR/CyaY-like superfamily)
MKKSNYLEDVLELHPEAEAKYKKMPAELQKRLHAKIHEVKTAETRIKRALQAVEHIMKWEPESHERSKTKK